VAAQAEALAPLIASVRVQAVESGWGFEGFTHVDCCLETDAARFRTKTIHREACRSAVVSRLPAFGEARGSCSR
jgi:hypothetical protein